MAGAVRQYGLCSRVRRGPHHGPQPQPHWVQLGPGLRLLEGIRAAGLRTCPLKGRASQIPFLPLEAGESQSQDTGMCARLQQL